MESNLEDRTEELSSLSDIEAGANLIRHVPLIYLFANALLRPVFSGQNPVDYYTNQDPINIAIVTTGFVVTSAGCFLKHMNDGNELQKICENEGKNNEEKKMVDSGMYKHTRHPCYLAQTLMATGLSIISPSIVSLLAFVGYVGLTEKCAIIEEKKNLSLFGKKYEKYLGEVQRWPSIKGSLKLLGIASDYLSARD